MQTAAEIMSDLIDRFLYTRSRTDLDTLIRAASMVAPANDLALPPHLDLVTRALAQATRPGIGAELAGLASQLRQVSGRDQDPDALAAALLLAQVAVRTGDRASVEGMLSAAILGSCLATDFWVNHRLGSLLESVVVLRDAYEAAELGSPVWITAATELAMSLKMLAEFQAENISLYEAEEIFALLLRTAPEYAEIASTYHNYADLLTVKYSRENDPKILDEIIRSHESSVAATDAGHPYFFVRRHGLAEALLNRFVQSDERTDDLDRAIRALEVQSSTTAMVAPPIAPPTLYSSFLLLRYDYQGAEEDFRRAVDHSPDFTTAAELLPATTAAGRRCLEGVIELLIWEKAPVEDRVVLAFDRFTEALELDRFKLSARWGVLAAAAAMPANEGFAEQATAQAESVNLTGIHGRWINDPLTIIMQRMFRRLETAAADRSE
ncbi:hypothetical protein [Kribbella speibonae]|uniref:Tetratricopeptide repeat protein n=1 Tax=Kribbella speibonae TaxID=1572660 RepID=A0A4R0J932_9ACTN|nr:hypothetical protein [Kribbella speibonae]TCC40838.1 hypothetical protein E0H92_03905 [Kribbella speibonae]